MTALEMSYLVVVACLLVIVACLLVKAGRPKKEFESFRILCGMVPVEEMHVFLDEEPVRTIETDPGINWKFALEGPLDNTPRFSVVEDLSGDYYQLAVSAYGGSPVLKLRYAHGELRQIAIDNLPSGVELKTWPD